MPDQGGQLALQQFLRGFDGIVPPGDQNRQVEVGERRPKGLGVGQVPFGQAQYRGEAADIGCGQGSFDESGTWRWVGEGGDDQQLLGVGHHDALVRIGVIGRAPQHSSSRRDPDDARQGVRFAGQIAHHRDVVTDHDGGTAEFAGAHADDSGVGVVGEYASPPSAIDGDHHGRLGILMCRTGFGAWPSAPARAYPDIGLIVLPLAQALIILAHIAGKSGSVLAVVPMSSTETPSVTRPTRAPAVAIR